MTIRNLSHVAVGVRDMDAALAFYRDVIGLDVRKDCIEEFGGVEGQPGVKRRGVYLGWRDGPDEPFVVLDQVLSRDAPGEPKVLYEPGIHHFGFWVGDLDAIVARARAAGTPVLYGPADSDTETYGEAAGGVIRLVMLNDPDGNIVQLDERAAR